MPSSVTNDSMSAGAEQRMRWERHCFEQRGPALGAYEWHNQNMQNTWNIATLLQTCMWLWDASERTLQMTEELRLSKCAVTILDRCTEVLIWIYFYHVYLSMYEYTCNHVTCVVYSHISLASDCSRIITLVRFDLSRITAIWRMRVHAWNSEFAWIDFMSRTCVFHETAFRNAFCLVWLCPLQGLSDCLWRNRSRLSTIFEDS